MFGLRNIGTPEAVDALSEGFSDSSPLFKHEIAFIFGQLLSPHSVPALLSVLEDSKEDDMVRHEAAEALGGIATPDVLPHLREWMKREDAPRVVRESCEVAIDMWEVSRKLILKTSSNLRPQSTRTRMNSSMLMVWNRQLRQPLCPHRHTSLFETSMFDPK